MSKSHDKRRRSALIAGSTAIGAVGLAGALFPFVSSLRPSARSEARSGPIKIKLSMIPEGELKIVEWAV